VDVKENKEKTMGKKFNSNQQGGHQLSPRTMGGNKIGGVKHKVLGGVARGGWVSQLDFSGPERNRGYWLVENS